MAQSLNLSGLWQCHPVPHGLLEDMTLHSLFMTGATLHSHQALDWMVSVRPWPTCPTPLVFLSRICHPPDLADLPPNLGYGSTQCTVIPGLHTIVQYHPSALHHHLCHHSQSQYRVMCLQMCIPHWLNTYWWYYPTCPLLYAHSTCSPLQHTSRYEPQIYNKYGVGSRILSTWELQ